MAAGYLVTVAYGSFVSRQLRREKMATAREAAAQEFTSRMKAWESQRKRGGRRSLPPVVQVWSLLEVWQDRRKQRR